MVYDEINHLTIDPNLEIERIIVGSFMNETRRTVYPINEGSASTGTIGFLDYSIESKTSDLRIILMGIEPNFKNEGYEYKLLETVEEKAKQLKKKRIFYIPKGNDISCFLDRGFKLKENFLEKKLS
ncbi:hypothetical protein KY334_03525 [Candidatus Woesearchaeota archaeon]|nr:hypothetical protein [Candidatus Woesearchaeota archaeon]